MLPEAVTYYYYDAGSIGGAIAGVGIFGIIIAVVWCLIGIACPIWMFFDLQKKDARLPVQNRCMDGSMVLAYWLVCFCTGCLGSCVFWMLATSEIDKRVITVQSGQMPMGMGPAYGQPMAQPAQAYPVAKVY